ncbi:hypothetical protein B2J86_00220 [Acidovorax sp. SRB_14]|uniref:hypothetical protein n=1 Tax=unclassified Acidovorax TaxID=2684926 RepID=UPI00145CCB01|nr:MULTISPECIES: hypothetical protein [unclassified Acidovorax]NMM76546.1 hypothetical protein [Acidovorax sp. SRB_24]NMM79368.1 hypothetical protein [Acidovorax sp. SRB_14]NMM84620.1 hypothetical protein [Rhodococcus sp. SRB_17]
MQPLVVTSAMTTLNGVFYPKGHVFALFKDEDSAKQAADSLYSSHHQGNIVHADPDCIRREITHTIEGIETTLPSPGADNDLVRRIDDLARRGFHGLLVEVHGKDNIENLQAAVEAHGAAAAFYYRTFIIEELVAQPKDMDDQTVVSGTHAAGPHPDAGTPPRTSGRS